MQGGKLSFIEMAGLVMAGIGGALVGFLYSVVAGLVRISDRWPQRPE